MAKIKMTCKCKDYKYWASVAIAFGIGMSFACFCPENFVLLVAAIIIAALGIVIAKH